MAPEPQHGDGMEGEAQKNSVNTKVTAEDPQTSDNDGGERSARTKLKETTITSAPQSFVANTSSEQEQGGEDSRESSRGRKRSFNEDQPEKDEDEPGHRKKRSRDSTPEDDKPVQSTAGESQPEKKVDSDEVSGKVLSPKKKRSIDQLHKDESTAEGVAEKSENKGSAENSATTERPEAEGEPEKKRHRDDEKKLKLDFSTSAFANTSTVSPFGAVGASKPQEPATSKEPAPTSSSAFAASSLSAFAGSEKSPFGSLGGSSPSVFKAATPTESDKPSPTGFASAATTGTSGFAALGSGFAGVGGGFGSGSKGGLTSFASPGGSVLTSTTKSKPFGAEEDDEENNEEEVNSGPGQFESDKTDERFFERPIETGEEEEKTYFACKAKLFHFTDKEWRERGVGTFKVNVKVTDGQENKKAARLVMRADGVLRVMLNTPIFKGMKVGDPSGNEPKTKQIHLASFENGRSVPILLRTGNDEIAKQLYHAVCDLLEYQ